MDLKEMINDNIAVLDAESNHQEMLAKEKQQRQREALKELYGEIQHTIKEAGYHIALYKQNKVFAKKWRTHEETWERSDEKVWIIQIEFEDSRPLKNTGESESFYAPHTKYAGQHCGSNASAYIKIVWDDNRGVYHIIPNVAFDRNEEVKGLDPLTYQELKGTKDMVIERLAVVLANAIRYEKSEAIRFAKHQEWKESLNG